MCYVPGVTEIAIASTVMSMASAAVGHMGQVEQANQMNDAFAANQEASIDAYQGDIEAANLDSMAAQESATQQRIAASQEGLAARGAARASAGERGAGGLSAAALERDLGFQSGQHVANINRNAELDGQRHRLNTRGARNAAQSRINSRQQSKGPSLMALGVKLGSSAASGYSMRQSMNAAAAVGQG
jgi:hypothetical protein